MHQPFTDDSYKCDINKYTLIYFTSYIVLLNIYTDGLFYINGICINANFVKYAHRVVIFT